MNRARRWTATALAAVVGAALASAPSVAHATDGGTASISGHVYDAQGNPLADVVVIAFPLDQGDSYTIESPITKADGSYTVSDELAGRYQVCFTTGLHDVGDQCYDDVEQRSDAAVITLADGQAVTGIDATMTQASHLRGTLTLPDGSPASNLEVRSYQLVNGSWVERREAYTGSDGTYDVAKDAAGTYRLGFGDDVDDEPDQYYPHAGTIAGGDDIHLARGQEIDGLDATYDPASATEPTPAPVSSPPRVRDVRRPTVTGTARVGRTLVAHPGAWNPGKVLVRYQWFVAGHEVARATGARFRIPASARGQRISVGATATARGYLAGQALSQRTAEVAPRRH